MKRILVTGATSGIGRATALKLAAPETEIIITGRRMDRLEVLKKEVEAKGATCMVLNFDVRSEAECIEHLTPLGRVDVLVNNAGLAAGLEHIDRGDSRDWDAMIDTNVKVIQVYAPTNNAEEAEVEWFYEDLQDLTPKIDVLYIIGDWNAKVGSQETPGVTSKFGLEIWNEAGQKLIEFCQENPLVIANTLFQQHKRRLYTWTSPDGQH